ncbi:hypothetical protein [Nocardia wallacei]|uniref:hypothetical protein n=1 Tax=Nocardia TaxID=1817 RepID=UPI002458B9AC|nr:hypothetical protein [Nocardia wallacei]
MADNSETRRGPSFSMLLAGVLALLVSVWAFIGPSSWPAHSIIPIGWIVVAAAIVVGIVLVVAPRKKKN